MKKINNTIAIGCLVQFYEIEIIEDFIKSLSYAKENIENHENVKVDICFNLNQGLEKLDEKKKLPQELKDRMERIVFDNLGFFNIEYWINDPNKLSITVPIFGNVGILLKTTDVALAVNTDTVSVVFKLKP